MSHFPAKNSLNQNFRDAYHHIRRQRVALELVQKKSGLKVRSLICDVGCGDGWYSLPLSRLGYLVIGIDLSSGRLRKAKMRIKNVDFVMGDVNKMPFRSNVFDLVICAQLLEHIVYPLRVVGECKRIVKNGHFLLFEVPSKSNIIDILVKKLPWTGRSPWTAWGLSIARTHVHFFSQEELLNVFLKHNLKVIEVKGAVALRYAMPLLSGMFWDPKRRWWRVLETIENIFSSIPKLKEYGAIQTFFLMKEG